MSAELADVLRRLEHQKRRLVRANRLIQVDRDHLAGVIREADGLFYDGQPAHALVKIRDTRIAMDAKVSA